jgi:hypothetical protein
MVRGIHDPIETKRIYNFGERQSKRKPSVSGMRRIFIRRHLAIIAAFAALVIMEKPALSAGPDEAKHNHPLGILMRN